MIDSHAHLDDEAFEGDREEILSDIEAQDIIVINSGANIQSSKNSINLSNRPNIYATIGIHPEYAKDFKDSDIDTLRELAKSPRVVAIGEIGLDYYYGKEYKESQIEAFEKQIILAKELNLPIVVHSRDAALDTLNMIKRHKEGLRGEMHCYSYSPEIMEEYVKLGFYIALGGVVTFKNAKNAVEVAREVPMDLLLIETDSPYLTPEPFRGKRNDPRNVRLVAERIAKIRGIDVETVINTTEKNALKLFGIRK